MGKRLLSPFLSISALVLAAQSSATQTAPQYQPGHSSSSGGIYDVAVIGAGLSGLSAAERLLSQGKNVVVVEALDRVGGKIKNHYWHNGGVTELGAAYVGPTQDRVLALAAELGLETFKEYQEGNSIATFDGGQNVLFPASASIPPQWDNETLLQLSALIQTIDTVAAGIDVEQPWNAPNASTLDAMTFQDWLNDYISTELAQHLLDFVSNTIWSGSPKQLSALYALSYVAGAGNQTEKGSIQRLVATRGGAQESRLVGGTGLLPEKLADKLGRDKIQLNHPVQAIARQANGHYIVTSANGTFEAESVIVAIAPPVAGRITYSPPLSEDRRQLQDRMFMGTVGKANALYKEPFWRQQNLSGMHIGNTGTVRATFDDSDKDASYGAIMGFLEGATLEALMDKTDDEIKALAVQDYVKYFGPEATNVEEWAIVRWNQEPYARGGPTALAGPGVFQRYGAALKRPEGGIFWAGTEASDYWPGYMDGAIRSGVRAADQVLASSKHA